MMGTVVYNRMTFSRFILIEKFPTNLGWLFSLALCDLSLLRIGVFSPG